MFFIKAYTEISELPLPPRKQTPKDPTYDPEGCELLPAGDEGAGPAHSMALARDLHVRDDRLNTQTKEKINQSSFNSKNILFVLFA